MASTIIIKNGAGSSTPSSLKQGEFAINVDSGKLFYGTSGSSNAVSSSFSFQHVTASGEVSASKVIADTISGGVGQNGLTLIGNVTASGIIDASPSKIVLGDLAANIAGRTITLDQTQTAALQFNMQTGAHIVASTDRFEITDTPGNLSAQLDVKGEITASGEVSSSSTGSFRALNITDDGVAKFNVDTNGHITASGDIRVAATSSQPTIINTNGIEFNPDGNANGTNFRVDDTNMRVAISTVEFEVVANKIELGSGTNHHVTASGNVSASGQIIAEAGPNINITLSSDNATNIDTFNTSSNNGAIYDYTLFSAPSGARAGQCMVIHYNGNTDFTDTSTNTLGTESSIPFFETTVNGANVEVKIASGSGYIFKAFTKKL